MILAAILQFAVCLFILVWLLKKKTNEKFTKKTVAKFILFGALSLAVSLTISMLSPIEEDFFFGMNPLLSGFLTALVTASLFEELMKYIFFRLALLKNREVKNWHDVIIACIITGIGFVLAEDIEYIISGDGSLIRAILPGHILFQALMGYFYGKARVTKKFGYHVLSLAVPIAAHTVFDMFIISLMSVVGGNPNMLSGLTKEELAEIPYSNYIIPLIICVIVVMVLFLITLIVTLKKISKWSKNGEKQELLK